METIGKIRILMTLALAVSGLGLAIGGIAFFLDNNRDRRSKLRPMIVVCTIGLCLSLYMSFFGLPKLERAKTERADREYRVFTADVITVQEKYISAGNIFTNGEPYIVITDGVDTVKIKVTDGIYEKYNPGDVYEHDADPVQFDTVPSTDVKAN